MLTKFTFQPGYDFIKYLGDCVSMSGKRIQPDYVAKNSQSELDCVEDCTNHEPPSILNENHLVNVEYKKDAFCNCHFVTKRKYKLQNKDDHLVIVGTGSSVDDHFCFVNQPKGTHI